MTARDVERTLAHWYLQRQTGWAFLREVTIDDLDVRADRRAWQLGDPIEPAYRRIDVLLMKTSSAAKPVPHERIAVEIKVTRADFRRDTPEKRRPWHAVAHRFAYATPPGLVTPDEVPDGCGLLEVDTEATGWTTVRWAKRAPRREEEPAAFDDRFVAYLAGRASRAEHQLRLTRTTEERTHP